MSGLLLGMGLLIFLLDFQRSTVRLEGGLIRNPYGKGKRVEELRAALEGGGSADLAVEVSEQAYDGAGIQELFNRSTALLEREILGENQSLDRIEQDMNLVTEVPGEPVDVSWELDRYDVMNVYGELQEEALSPEGTLVNLKAVLYDGSYHPVDSSEIAFKTAAQLAYKAALPEASPVLLEPVGELKVTVPDSYMGDVIGDLNKRRGRVMGMDPTGDGSQVISAEVPMAEMGSYAIDLRSMTQSRGSFTFHFVRYEDCPPAAQEKAIAEAKALAEQQ